MKEIIIPNLCRVQRPDVIINRKFYGSCNKSNTESESKRKEGDYKFYEKLLGFSSPSSDKLKKTYFETDQRNPIYVICSTNMFTT